MDITNGADDRPNGAPSVQGGTPALTINDAALAVGRHRNSLRRALDAQKFPNAYRLEGSGPWLVPVTDLEHAGYKLLASSSVASAIVGPPDPDLAQRLAVAEAVAAERAARIADLERSLADLRNVVNRMLPPAPAEPVEPNRSSDLVERDTSTTPTPRRRTLLDRLIGGRR